MRECKGICLRTGGEYKDLFIKKKRYNYSKESECKTCSVGIKKTTFTNVPLGIGVESKEHHKLRLVPIMMQFPDPFECPCCGAEVIGRELPQVKQYFTIDENGKQGNPVYIKTNPLENRDKSYKELMRELEKKGLKPVNFTLREYKRQLGQNLRPKTNTKQGIEEFLDYFGSKVEDQRDYENKLSILQQYDDSGFERSRYSNWPYDTRFDTQFIMQLDDLDNDKQREHYIRKFLKIRDEFARKYKLGMGGLTEQEQEIEANKRLEEGNRRRAEIGPKGQWIFPFPHYDKDGNEITRDEPERKTSHAN